MQEWAKELKIEPSQLSRWLSGKTKKIPEHIKPILPIIRANLKAHKSNKFLQQNIATNESIVDLASNSNIHIQGVRGSNPLLPTIK